MRMLNGTDGVKSWMTWWGWTNGGAPGSARLDAYGGIIARHGDKTWQADVELAIEGSTKPSSPPLSAETE